MTLDLNGQTVTPDGGTLTVGSGASLKILDSNVTEVGIANGTLISSADAAGTILLEGKAKLFLTSGTIRNTTGYAIVSQQSGAEIQLNGGTVTGGNAAVFVSNGCSLTMNGGTLEGGNSGYGYGIYMTGGKATVSSGTVSSTSATAVYVSATGELELRENAIISGSVFGISAVDSAAVTMLGGTVEGTGSAGVGISLQNTSTLNMQGGAVTGRSCGISVGSTASATISGGTVTLTTDNPDPTYDEYAVFGLFTFTGGTLRAKSATALCNDETVLKNSTTSDVNVSGYYLLTPASGF